MSTKIYQANSLTREVTRPLRVKTSGAGTFASPYTGWLPPQLPIAGFTTIVFQGDRQGQTYFALPAAWSVGAYMGLRLVGEGDVTLVNTGAGGGDMILSQGPVGETTGSNTLYDLVIENLNLHGGGLVGSVANAAANAIRYRLSHRIIIDNVRIQGVTGFGVDFDGYTVTGNIRDLLIGKNTQPETDFDDVIVPDIGIRVRMEASIQPGIDGTVTLLEFHNATVGYCGTCGVQIEDGQEIRFRGGSSAGNYGPNVTIANGVNNVEFDNVNLESSHLNTVSVTNVGVTCAGRAITFNNCNSMESIELTTDADLCTIRKGQWYNIIDNSPSSEIDRPYVFGSISGTRHWAVIRPQIPDATHPTLQAIVNRNDIDEIEPFGVLNVNTGGASIAYMVARAKNGTLGRVGFGQAAANGNYGLPILAGDAIVIGPSGKQMVAMDNDFNRMPIVCGAVLAGGPVSHKSYTVATLPTPGTGGREAWASNGRAGGEGSGAGTGVLVFDNGTTWKACDTGTAVAA